MNGLSGALNVLILAGLLVLPAIAGQRAGVDFRWVGAYGVLLSGLTYWAYAVDKRRAEEREWRVPEARLYLLELLGDWPGALLAQRRLPHKCSKGSYQVVFWLIGLAYQFATFDSFHDWQFARPALNRFIGPPASHPKAPPMRPEGSYKAPTKPGDGPLESECRMKNEE